MGLSTQKQKKKTLNVYSTPFFLYYLIVNLETVPLEVQKKVRRKINQIKNWRS